MKVCFPVDMNQGLESQVYGHFGSAPGFVVVDMITSEVTAINNSDQIHQHGACNPVAGLGGHQVDAIIVGGIGGGALHKLNASGLRVFQAQTGTVSENVALFQANGLQEFLPGHTCGGHSHDQGCSH
ncbi:MAG: diguanylate cyclase [Geobacteraceae bacterium]|nr:diguanylate cyclase [Geobacteraceae bacterium]